MARRVGTVRRRKVTGVFARMTEFHALRAAALRASRGLRTRRAPASFLSDLERNVVALRASLLDDSWRPGPMRTFRIRDPKPRTIAVAPFPDRVVHHALCAELTPMFDRFADADSYACRVGGGQHRAVERLRTLTRRHEWYGRLDVRHYFESVHHDVLLERLERRVADPAALRVVEHLLAAGVGPAGIGLPIGNLTSQHFGNFLLGHVDHFAREVVKVDAWVRYMDDIVILGDDRERVWGQIAELDAHLRSDLRLIWKDSATRVGRVCGGVPFLGVRVWPELVRFDGVRLRRARRALAANVRAARVGDASAEDSARRASAMIAWMELGHSKAWRARRAGAWHADGA